MNSKIRDFVSDDAEEVNAVRWSAVLLLPTKSAGETTSRAQTVRFISIDSRTSPAPCALLPGWAR